MEIGKYEMALEARKIAHELMDIIEGKFRQTQNSILGEHWKTSKYVISFHISSNDSKWHLYLEHC